MSEYNTWSLVVTHYGKLSRAQYRDGLKDRDKKDRQTDRDRERKI